MSRLSVSAGPVGREFLLDQAAQIGALPARLRQDRVRARQRPDAAFDRRRYRPPTSSARVSRTIDCTTASAFLAR